MSDLPSVEDLPVLPDFACQSDVDLGVTPDGRVYLFFRVPHPEPVDYILYNIAQGMMQFVGETGRLQDLGMKVQPAVRDLMQCATEANLVHVQDGGVASFDTVPLMIDRYE